MTVPSPPQRVVRCPICVDTFTWSTDTLYEWSDRGYVDLHIPSGADEAKRRDMIRAASVRCPNPSGDMQPHYLPVTVVSSGQPLVIGLVGATKAGKSHLLAAMVHEIASQKLHDYGLQFFPVDLNQHRSYLDTYVRPFVAGGGRLEGTAEGRSTDYAYSMLLQSRTGTRAVTFFDIAGGDLLRTGRAGRFLAGTGGLIFTVDPRTALGLGTVDDPSPEDDLSAGDDTFQAVLTRLRPDDAPYLEVPAAIVLTKADRLRFEDPVESWMRARPAQKLSPRTIAAESRDVYAFLHSRSAAAWLSPFHSCRRCTLHFVSATGGESSDGRYQRTVRPNRVLEPLLSLFAMTGVIDGPDVAEVGRS